MATVTNTFTDTLAITYSGNGKSVSSKIGSYTGTRDAGVATVVPAGTTNQLITIAFPYASIQACIVECDQDVTVKVNSTTTPVPLLTVKKTAAIVWGTDFTGSNPFTADVTAMYVTNSGTTDAKFNVRVLYT